MLRRRASIAAHEVGFELLRRAETREPHTTLLMTSGNSKGPIVLWLCPHPKCGRTAYSYVPGDAPPLCSGGYAFSFTTVSSYDV